MTPAEIRQRIDTLECLGEVTVAIEEIASGEPGDRVKLAVADRNEAAITFVHGLPPEVLLVGLRAMERNLSARLAEPERKSVAA